MFKEEDININNYVCLFFSIISRFFFFLKIIYFCKYSLNITKILHLQMSVMEVNLQQNQCSVFIFVSKATLLFIHR